MIKPVSGSFDDPRFAVLTPREHDVLHYLVCGMPNKVIAAELGVSQRTVEAHRARIFRKLNVRNVVELSHLYWGLTPICPTGQKPRAGVNGARSGSARAARRVAPVHSRAA